MVGRYVSVTVSPKTLQKHIVYYIFDIIIWLDYINDIQHILNVKHTKHI